MRSGTRATAPTGTATQDRPRSDSRQHDASEGDAQRWRLNDEREFLTRSLRDAELEHDVGDLADADYELLRRRDEARLAEVEAALAEAVAREKAAAREEAAARDEGGSEEERREGLGEAGHGRSRAGRRPARRRRSWLAVGGVAVLIAGAILLVVQLTSARLPGQTPTGGPSLSAQQQAAEELTQAETVEQEGQTSEAIALYAKVLSTEPKQSVALAEWGWLVWEQGTTRHDGALRDAGVSAVRESVRIAPGAAAGHLYLGSIDLLQLHEAATAATQYRLLLAAHPPASVVAGAASLIRRAFEQSGQQVPAGVPSG